MPIKSLPTFHGRGNRFASPLVPVPSAVDGSVPFALRSASAPMAHASPEGVASAVPFVSGSSVAEGPTVPAPRIDATAVESAVDPSAVDRCPVPNRF